MRSPDVVHVAITCADDTLAVMAFVTCEYNADDSVRWSRPAYAELVEAEVARASVSFPPEKVPVKGWRPIDPADVPKDRTYRNALRDTGTAIEHDMEKVKQLAVDDVREERAPVMVTLDAEWMKATGQADAKAAAEVEAKRQALRDLPAVTAEALKAARTVEEVKALKPDVAALASAAPMKAARI